MTDSEIFPIGVFDETDSDFAPLAAPLVENIETVSDTRVEDWIMLRSETQGRQNTAFKNYSSLTQAQAQTAFRYMCSWRNPKVYHNPKYEKLYNDMLSAVLWSKSKVQSINEEILLAQVSKKLRFEDIVKKVSRCIQNHYHGKFMLLSKFGGIPRVFRSTTVACDLMAVHLVRRVLTTCDSEVAYLLRDHKKLEAGCVDPLQSFIASQPIVLRDCETVATEIFGSIMEELLSVSPERFIRMVVGAAAVRLTDAAAMEALDITKPNKFDWELERDAQRDGQREWARRWALDSNFTKPQKEPRSIVLGVMRNACLNDGEYRATITFTPPNTPNKPPCTLFVHVPMGVQLQEILTFAKNAYADLRGMLEESGIVYGLFWPEESRFYQHLDPPIPDRRNGRLAAVGNTRACLGVNVVLDALPLHDLVDQIDSVQARTTAELAVDALNNIPYFPGRTDIVVKIPGLRGDFETRRFIVQPAKKQYNKPHAEVFKRKLTSVVASIKKYTATRLDKHENSFCSRVTNPGDNEIKFFRNIAKIDFKVSQWTPHF
jgi:hypothetical protein